MSLDIREGPASFYDLSPNHPNDIPFYVERIPFAEARVLELGCGTGRVSVPLAQAHDRELIGPRTLNGHRLTPARVSASMLY